MDIQEKLIHFKYEVGKVIIGKEKVIELIFVSMLQKGHILFESVPGTGKTMLSKSVARAIDGTFKRISLRRIYWLPILQGSIYINLKPRSLNFGAARSILIYSVWTKATERRREPSQPCLR